MTEKRSQFVSLCLWLLIGASLVVRFRWAFVYNPLDDLVSDSLRHWDHARHPLGEGPVAAVDPLGYQLWLGSIARITQGDRYMLGIYAGLLSVVSPWFWYKFLRELLPERNLALFGWALLSLMPSWMSIFCHFMPETLLLPLFGLALWLTFRARRKRSYESYVQMVLAWAAACLANSTVAPVAIIAILWLGLFSEDRVRRLGFSTLTASALLIPFAYRIFLILNVVAPAGVFMGLQELYYLSGKLEQHALISTKGVLVADYHFISPEVLDHPFAPLSNWSTTRTGVVTVVVETENGSADWDKARAENRGNLAQRTQMYMENVIFLLWGSSWPEWHNSRFWDWLQTTTRWIWAPLIFCSFTAQFYFRKRRSEGNLLLAMHAVAWLGLFLIPISVAEGRLRKPFEGFLVTILLWAWSVRQEGKRLRGETNDEPS